jgi:DNA-binding response OmpR family regulator
MTKPAATPAPTVLVVERSPAIRRLLDVVLRDVASRVFFVDDPAGARTILRDESVDVVVLEPQGASRLDWDLLDELVATGMPTVVVTSRADEQILNEATGRGAVAVMMKPFNPPQLKAVINATYVSHPGKP